MSTATHLPLTVVDYLQGELAADIKHEFINGVAYAMAGASKAHNIISLNIAVELKYQLKGKPCKPYIADMKVQAQGDFYYPDVMVVCDDHKDDTQHVVNGPMLIVEVLPQSTRAIDHSIKQDKYLKIAALEYYILIEQDFCEIAVLSRAAGFIAQYYYLGDDIHFPLLDVVISVVDIYDAIDNSDQQNYRLSLNE